MRRNAGLRLPPLKSLFWKISGTFLSILLLFAVVFLSISIYTADMYFKEAHQKLNSDVAKHIAEETNCYVDGRVNHEVLKEVFHDVMIINPSLEVYLIDLDGKILTYFAPNKTIKLDIIPLHPIKSFIEQNGNIFLMGTDPKNPQQERPFSAALVYEDNKPRGYIYVILGGEEYENATHMVFGSYIMSLGVRSMAITLIAAAVISLIALGFITRNVRTIINVIREFKNGDLSARIKLKGSSELIEFGDAFNEMADKIVLNIEEIKAVDRLRRDLVANVSHDLRTPLATIQGYIETILMKEDSMTDEDKKKYLSTVLAGTERLKTLVDELFELSKLEARQIHPEPEVFSVAELIQDIQQKNLLIAETKGIEFTVAFSYDLPLAYADIGMMEKVIQNLIDNAFKFTHSGGKVSIRLTQENNHITFSISDTGEGIPENELKHIFDRYHRSKRAGQENNKGLGLGLTIVKKILEIHNIDIRVESIAGKGTSFYFRLPTASKPAEIKTHQSISL